MDGSIGHAEFGHQHGQRALVADDVMHDHHEHMLVGRQPEKPHTQQRPRLQIERCSLQHRYRLLQACMAVRLGKPAEILPVHDLIGHIPPALPDRSRLIGLEHHAELRMPLDEQPESCLDGVCIQPARQTLHGADVIGACRGVELPQEPLALLGIRGTRPCLFRMRSRNHRKLADAQSLGRHALIHRTLRLGRQSGKLNGQCLQPVVGVCHVSSTVRK